MRLMRPVQTLPVLPEDVGLTEWCVALGSHVVIQPVVGHPVHHVGAVVGSDVVADERGGRRAAEGSPVTPHDGVSGRPSPPEVLP